MSIEQIVAELVIERDKLNRAIDVLGGSDAKRRGRPPQSASTVATSAPKAEPARKRKGMTPAQKKAHSERMRAFWAKRRLAKKT